MSFAFGDEVRITAADRMPEHADRIGVIVGIGEDDGGGASYAVRLQADGTIVSLWESELSAVRS